MKARSALLLSLVLFVPSPLPAQDGSIQVAQRWGAGTLAHGGRVTALAHSPDGKWLAAGDEAGGLALWPTEAGAGRWFRKGGAAVGAIAFSTSGDGLAAVYEDGTAEEYWTSSGRLRYSFPAAWGRLHAVAYGPEDKTIFTGGDFGQLRRWDRTSNAGFLGILVGLVADGVVILAVEPGSPAAAAGLAPRQILRSADGTAIAHPTAWIGFITSKSAGQTIRLEVAGDGTAAPRAIEVTLADPPPNRRAPRLAEDLGASATIAGLVVSAAGDRLYCGHLGGDVTTWWISYPLLGVSLGPTVEGQRGLLVTETTAGMPAARAGLAANDRIVGVDGTEVTAVDVLREALGRARPGQKIVVAALRGSEEKRFEVVLDQQRTIPVSEGRLLTRRLLGLARIPTGDVLAVDESGKVGRLSSDAREMRTVGAGIGARSASFALLPGGKAIAVGTVAGGVVTYDVESGTVLRRYDSKDRPSCDAISVRPGGATLAVAGGSRIRRLELPAGTPVADPEGPAGAFTSVAVSDDGRRVLAADETGGIWLWAPEEGAMRQIGSHGDRVPSVAIRPDGRMGASAGLDHAVRIWDLESGRQSLYFYMTHDATSVAFSTDGTLLAVTDHLSSQTWSVAALESPPPSTRIVFPLGLRAAERGLTIDRIDPVGGQAYAAFEVGDRLVSIDGTAVGGAEDIQRALSAKKPGDPIRIEVQGSGAVSPRSIEVPLLSGPADIRPSNEWNDMSLAPRECALSPDGKTLWVLGEAERLGLFEVGGRQLLRVALRLGGADRVASGLGSRQVLIAGEGGAIHLDLENQAQRILVAEPRVVGLATGGARHHVLTADGNLTLWNPASLDAPETSFAFACGASALGISTTGELGVVALADHTLALWRRSGR